MVALRFVGSIADFCDNGCRHMQTLRRTDWKRLQSR